MLSGLTSIVAAPPLNYNHDIDLDHMTRSQAVVALFFGLALVLILGAFSANVKGISYKISVNGKAPGETGYRAKVVVFRVVTGVFALIGAFMIIKSMAVLLG